jgi:Tfp pilus assembly protein PilP
MNNLYSFITLRKFWLILFQYLLVSIFFNVIKPAFADEVSDMKIDKKYNLFQDKTSIKNPFSLRDPFSEPIVKSKVEDGVKLGLLRDGIFTNLPSIEDVEVEEIAIVGILLGKERRALAMIKDGDGETFVLKEGMKLGKDSAEIKAILPNGLMLAEKITNVYGQIEYLETVLTIADEELINKLKEQKKNP